MKLTRLIFSAALAGAVFAPPATAAEEPLLCPEDLLPYGVENASAPRATETDFDSCGLNIAEGESTPRVSARAWIVFDPETGDVVATNGPHDRFVAGEFARLIFVAVVLQNYEPDEILANGLSVTANLTAYLNQEIDTTIFQIEDVNGQANRWLAQLPISDTMVDTLGLAMSSSPVDIARMVRDLWLNPEYQEFLELEAENQAAILGDPSVVQYPILPGTRGVDQQDILMHYGTTNPLGLTNQVTIVDDKAVVLFDATSPDTDLRALLRLDGEVGTIDPYVAPPPPEPETKKAPTGFAIGGLVALLILGVTLRYMR